MSIEEIEPQAVCEAAFAHITRKNTSRAKDWHGEQQWSLLEWSGAMCGEAGEIANTAKKLRRLEQAINPESKGGNTAETRAALLEALGEEIADTFLYLNLLAAEAGVDMWHVIQSKFNQVSERDGRPQRL